MPTHPVARREALTIIWKSLLGLSGLLGLGGLARFLSYQPPEGPPAVVEAGLEGQYPVGTRVVLAEAAIILTREADGFRAFSLICPHLGCQVRPQADGFECPCHGSRFDDQGALQRGPAARGLQAFEVQVGADGIVRVQKIPGK